MAINFQNTCFVKSAMKLSQLPHDTGKEIAFAGRSNAGKSSALNSITGVKNLAKISKTPGRTQCINVFAVSSTQRLMDIPGYGYAKVPLPLKRQWDQLLNEYFLKRDSLQGVCLMMDIRHPMGEKDTEMITWAVSTQLPIHILLTKSDKLSRGKSLQVLSSVKKILKNEFEYADISCQLFSAVSAEGLLEARKKISAWLS